MREEIDQITGHIVDDAMKVHTALGPGLLESIYDLLVEEEVVVELKVVERILEIHRAQLLSHLRLASKRVGLFIYFNEVHLKDGIRRLVSRVDTADAAGQGGQ